MLLKQEEIDHLSGLFITFHIPHSWGLTENYCSWLASQEKIVALTSHTKLAAGLHYC